MSIKIIKEDYKTWDKDINKILELIDKLELPLEADMRTQVLNKLVKIRHTINATIKDFMDLSSESRNLSSFKESLKTSYYIAVTAVAPHDITNQRYFTGKGISSEPRDAKTYDSKEAAKADFKKVPKKYRNELIRDVRVLKKYVKGESKRLKESYYGLFEYTSGGPEDGIYCDHCDLLDVTIADSEEEAERIFNKKHDYESSYYVNEIDEAEYNEFIGEDGIIDVTESKRLKESLREFDKFDWNTYGGAQEFKDGSNPLIYDESENFGLMVGGVSDDLDKRYDAIVETWFDDDNDPNMNPYLRSFTDKSKAVRAASRIIKIFEDNPNLTFDDYRDTLEDFGFTKAY